MNYSQINTRYAKALFQLAEENGVLNEIREDIDWLLMVLDDHPEIITFLEHPIVKTSQKTTLIDRIFKGTVKKETLSLLNLVVKKNREKYLKEICNHFVVIYKKNKGIRTATITTSFDLSRTHKENIKRSVEKVFKAPVELETKVNESIIGGLIIQLDDKQLDLSVARQIKQLKSKLFDIDFDNSKRKIKN